MPKESFPWEAPTSADAEFQPTAWTDLRAIAAGSDPIRQRDALERLCRTYWKPVYAFIRRRGHPAEPARDLTQDFFYHLLRKERLKLADQRKGRFRSFILKAVQNFLASDWDRQSAQKRDVRRVVSLDEAMGDGDWIQEPAGHDATPDQVFDRLWALDLLANVRQRLDSELALAEHDFLRRLVPAAILGDHDMSYATMAVELGKTEAAIKKSVERLRARWEQLLREEVAATVQTADEVEDELREILVLLQR
ncbi:MAG TPA: sigma-70 family RNA polymerase sigma factor [Verrucomicrobiota bacterium]|nr:sigma-70 family RNA polymerase sigma factor [Verrucomicrobiota bacterium]